VPANSIDVPSGPNLVIEVGTQIAASHVSGLRSLLRMASLYERLNALSNVQLHRMGLDRSTLARDAIHAVEARVRISNKRCDRATWSRKH
jgi:hypothetical protein